MNIRQSIFLSVLFALAIPFAASALILSHTGNDPATDPGWPDGALALGNLHSRVGWFEGPPFGGGETHFLYRGDAQTFSNALARFAVIRAPLLELILHDGPETNLFLEGDGRVDWTFTVWQPASWNRLYNNPKSVWNANDPNFRKPVAPPRLDVYLGNGQIDWSRVKVPAGIQVRDERSSASGVDLSNGLVIRAEVFDMDTGKAISGAHLIVEKTWWTNSPNPHWETVPFADVESDASGRVEVKNIPSDAIKVSLRAKGYAPRLLDQQGHPRSTLLKFSVQLAKAVSIRGIVTDGDGKPIKGAKVRPMTLLGSNGQGYDNGLNYEPIETFTVETDPNGAFDLSDLPAGFAQLSVIEDGYHFSDVFTIHDVPGSNVVLRLERAGTIDVSVTDKNGNALSRVEGNPLLVDMKPVDEQKINWSGGSNVKVDGTCEFKNVPPGQYKITSRPNPSIGNKQYPPEQIVTVQAGEDTHVKITYE